jgi:hypothetical protein
MRTIKLISGIAFFMIMSLGCSSSSSDSAPTCEQAQAATLVAEQAYSSATAANHEDLCNAYRAALQTEMDVCGDPNGELQAIIADLGDCTLSTTTGTLSMNLGSAPLAFDVITVTTNGTTRHIHGEKSNSTSYEIDFDVEVGQTGANKINNFQLRLFSQTFTPLIPAQFGSDWASAITTNSSTSVVGTFHGELANPGQTSAQDLLNGVVNINF